MSILVRKFFLEKHLRAMFLDDLQEKFGPRKAGKILDKMLHELEDKTDDPSWFEDEGERFRKLLEETIKKIEEEKQR